MTRFEQLEFDDPKKPAAHDIRDNATSSTPDTSIRNEGYYYKAAITCWLAGDFEMALRNFSRSLESSSSFFEGWLGQVQMLIELGEYPEAALWADKALKLFPENSDLLAAKAVALAHDGKYEQAMAFSDVSISKENISSRTWLARAQVLMARKSQIAKTCISNAVSIAGDLAPVIRLDAGPLLAKNEEYYAALEYLNSAVRLLPKSALAWYELGICEAKLGRSEAATTLKQAHKLNPNWPLPKEAIKTVENRGFLSRLLRRLFRR